jgi:uncharacterized SAM-binding protein YcdF (DUF218 family)
MTPSLTPGLIGEITEIVFGPVMASPEPCDIIFIFGGSHPGLWEKTAEAYHAGLGKAILATGGHKPRVQYHSSWTDGTTPESHVIRRELIKLHVPDEIIFVEDKSTNSLENVLFAKDVYDFTKVTSILAVCKCYGAGRQCRTLKQHVDPSVKVIPYSFDTNIGSHVPFVTRYTWMNFEEGRAFVSTQVMKIVNYGKLGHLQPVEYMSSQLVELINKDLAVR